MRTLFFSLFLLFISLNISAQKEKINGNKIVTSEVKMTDTFHTIEVYDNFEISIDQDSDHMINIETDSNLMEFIIAEVVDGVLKIKSEKDIRRSKALHITISYASDLQRIAFYDKVTAKSISALKSSNIRVEAHDNTEVFLSINADKVTSILHGKSNAELHVNSKNTFYQVNENSELKGIITTDSLKIDLYQNGYAKLEGDVKSALIRADNDVDFYGEKLTIDKASIVAEKKSDCYVLVKNEIDISAIDQTEIYLLGEPIISITSFLHEAILYKKNIEYTPSRLKL
ncbi:hypothetical protein GCM10022393_30040 [Aquimarina addita]|uniref:Putative auto-transporter adhesin head GIN domain-containing protein n=1 Tax=Aquimarina addita TaxID=870485 RepID=A0ABP6UN63_9FLAO